MEWGKVLEKVGQNVHLNWLHLIFCRMVMRMRILDFSIVLRYYNVRSLRYFCFESRDVKTWTQIFVIGLMDGLYIPKFHVIFLLWWVLVGKANQFGWYPGLESKVGWWNLRSAVQFLVVHQAISSHWLVTFLVAEVRCSHIRFGGQGR